jgi:hypothetical protein
MSYRSCGKTGKSENERKKDGRKGNEWEGEKM